MGTKMDMIFVSGWASGGKFYITGLRINSDNYGPSVKASFDPLDGLEVVWVRVMENRKSCI